MFCPSSTEEPTAYRNLAAPTPKRGSPIVYDLVACVKRNLKLELTKKCIHSRIKPRENTILWRRRMQNNLRRFMRKYTKLLSLFLVLVFIFSLMQSPMAMATGTEDGDEEQAEQRSAPPDSGGGDEGTGGGNDNAGGGSEGGEGSDTTNPPANPDGGGNPPVDQGSGVDGTGSDPTNPSSGTGESGSGDDPTTPTSPVNPGSIIGGGGDGSGTGDDLPAIRGDAALGATRATAPYTVSNSANYAMRDTSFISNHYYYCVTGERLSDFGSLACHNLKVTATGNTFPVFCIQPNLPASEQGYDDPDPAYPWTSFSSEVQTLIVKALYWGYPSYNDSATGDNNANHAATQAMVFDIVCGLSSTRAARSRTSPSKREA